ncbi:MAG: hypothetical protein LC650_05945 [Actinobacteria bacterium]|nr:hypothetical protein [Actinomycetota bacterium]
MNKGLKLPTPNLMLSFALRRVPEQNYELFKWYWTKALTKLVNSKKWCQEVYFYTTILKAKFVPFDKNSKALFTVSHEAMVCLVWENNYEKWQEQKKWRDVPENKKKKMPIIPGKWSSSTEGQAEWGGWSEEGLRKYNELKKAIRNNRKKEGEKLHAFEEKFLRKLRVDAGIDCENHEQQQKMNRAKRRKLNADKPVGEIRVHKAVSTVDDEDEQEVV